MAHREQSHGPIIAVGSRSVVCEWGSDAVAKVPDDGVPSSWIRHESEFTEAVWRVGVPAHRPLGVEEANDAQFSLYERVDGPTLWMMIAEAPQLAVHYGQLLGVLHARVLSSPPPVSLPRQTDRLHCKLRRACAASGVSLAEVADAMPTTSRTVRLCHGDFHPGNIIMSGDGPVIVDWFDACRGDAAGDIARTSLLLGAGRLNTEHVRHLPGHSAALLLDVHDAYLSTVRGLMGIDVQLVERWRRVEAIARVDEGLDPASLLELWAESAS